jgi:hypothetical protein
VKQSTTKSIYAELFDLAQRTAISPDDKAKLRRVYRKLVRLAANEIERLEGVGADINMAEVARQFAITPNALRVERFRRRHHTTVSFETLKA